MDSIVFNRHEIAHGETSGIRFATISDYWTRARRVLDRQDDHLQ